MSGKTERFATVQPKDRDAWRRWLAKNHGGTASVWLVINKKGTQGPGVTYELAVEEALCFGWIDGRINPIDEEKYRLLFSPRRPGSTWARSNKERVAKLIEQGLVTEAGLKAVESAKRNGSWYSLDAIEELRIPPDLEKALAGRKTAQENFDAFGSSVKKSILWWIESAKRPETRTRRIAETVRQAEDNKKPF